MNIIYTTAPRFPAKNNQSESHSPHWLITVVEGMRVLSSNYQDESVVRVKRIMYQGRVAYLLKNHNNKTRVIMYGAGNKIYTFAAAPPAPDLSSPMLPLYPQPDDDDCEKKVFSMDANELHLLAKYCVEQMVKRTYYSDGDFLRIPIHTDHLELTAASFFCGRIGRAKQVVRQNVPYWLIDVYNKGGTGSFEVQVAAIRYSDVKEGYFLIYKNEEEADIISENELGAFYTDVKETLLA